MKIIGKIVVIILIFLAGLFIGMSQVKSPAADLLPNENISSTLPQVQTVKLIINDGTVNIKTFESVEIVSGQTVFDLLQQALAKNNLEFSFKDYGGSLGKLVESIGGVKNDSAKNTYWQYWVNGDFALVGASGYQVKSGDIIEWKYVVDEFNK